MLLPASTDGPMRIAECEGCMKGKGIKQPHDMTIESTVKLFVDDMARAS